MTKNDINILVKSFSLDIDHTNEFGMLEGGEFVAVKSSRSISEDSPNHVKQ